MLLQTETGDGLWAVIGVGLPYGNYPLLAGKPTINSTNVYPNMNLWHTIDTNKEYEEVYNRYAHITVELCDDRNTAARFELTNPDAFTVRMTTEELKRVGVRYLYTPLELDQHGLTKRSEANGWKIYEIL